MQWLTSTGDPMLGARGSIARPGTKNTGSHLAKNPAPGVSEVNIASPSPGLTTSNKFIRTNRMQHPPNWDGKEIPFAWKILRNKWSRTRNIAAPLNSFDAGKGIAPPLWRLFDDRTSLRWSFFKSTTDCVELATVSVIRLGRNALCGLTSRRHETTANVLRTSNNASLPWLWRAIVGYWLVSPLSIRDGGRIQPSNLWWDAVWDAGMNDRQRWQKMTLVNKNERGRK